MFTVRVLLVRSVAIGCAAVLTAALGSTTAAFGAASDAPSIVDAMLGEGFTSLEAVAETEYQPASAPAGPDSGQGLAIRSTSLVTFDVGGPLDQADLAVSPELGVTQLNDGLADVGAGQTTATLVMVETDRPPSLADNEITNISLAFRYAGQETLATSPFANDPLLGYSTVIDRGVAQAEDFTSYQEVVGGSWQLFQDPVATYEFYVDRPGPVGFRSAPDDWEAGYVMAWLVFGAPEALAVIASHAGNAVAEELYFLKVELELADSFGTYDPDDLDAIDDAIEDLVDATITFDEFLLRTGLGGEPETGDGVVDGAEDGGEETGDVAVTPPPDEEPTDESLSGDVPGEDEPTDTSSSGDETAAAAPADTSPPTTERAGETGQGSSGGSALPLIITGAGVVVVLLVLGWIFLFLPKKKKQRGHEGQGDALGDDVAAPPVRMDRYGAPHQAMGHQRWAVGLLGEAQREEAPSNDDGWWAPSNAADHHAHSTLAVSEERLASLQATAEMWSGKFVNEHTLEIVNESDGERWEELRSEFGFDRPPSHDGYVVEHDVEPTMATSIGEQVNILVESQDRGPEPTDDHPDDEEETDLSGLLDTPEERAKSEMFEAMKNAGPPEEDWGDADDGDAGEEPMPPAEAAEHFPDVGMPMRRVIEDQILLSDMDFEEWGHPVGDLGGDPPTLRQMTWREQADWWNETRTPEELARGDWYTADDVRAATSMATADAPVRANNWLNRAVDEAVYGGEFFLYFIWERTKDTFTGQDVTRLKSFFHEYATYDALGENWESLKQSLSTAHEGWSDILVHPELLGTLDEATADAARAVKADLDRLAVLARTDDEAFAREAARFTKSAHLEALVGFPGFKVVQKLKATGKAPTGAGTGRPSGQVFHPDEVPELPNARRQAIPDRHQAPSQRDPSEHLGRAMRALDDPKGYGVAPGAKIAPPLKGVTPVKLQTHSHGCLLATLESMLTDLPGKAISQGALRYAAQRLRKWDGTGLILRDIRGILGFYTDIRLIAKRFLFERFKLDPDVGVTSQLAQIQARYPNSPIMLRVRWLDPDQNIGHAVRFEGFDDNLMVSISDPAFPESMSFRLPPDVCDALFREAFVIIP